MNKLRRLYLFFILAVLFSTFSYTENLEQNKKDVYIFIDISNSMKPVFNDVQEYLIEDILPEIEYGQKLVIFKFYRKMVPIFDMIVKDEKDLNYAKSQVGLLLANGPWTNIDNIFNYIKENKLDSNNAIIFLCTDGHVQLENNSSDYFLNNENIQSYLENVELIKKNGWFLCKFKKIKIENTKIEKQVVVTTPEKPANTVLEKPQEQFQFKFNKKMALFFLLLILLLSIFVFIKHKYKLSKIPVGLILAGGGGKGSYQIGVWKALNQLGVDKKIKGYSGTSIGGLNAGLFAIGDYNNAEKTWLSLSTEKILPLNEDIIENIKKMEPIVGDILETYLKKLRSSEGDKYLEEEYITELEKYEIAQEDIKLIQRVISNRTNKNASMNKLDLINLIQVFLDDLKEIDFNQLSKIDINRMRSIFLKYFLRFPPILMVKVIYRVSEFIPISGLFSRNGLSDILECLDINKIKNSSKPVFVTSTEENEGKSHTNFYYLMSTILFLVNENISISVDVNKFNDENNFHENSKNIQGETLDNIYAHFRATSALPFVYPYEIINGLKNWDGGLRDNNPIKVLCEYFTKNKSEDIYMKFIVVCLNPKGILPEGYITTKLSKYSNADLLVITPDHPFGDSFFDMLDFSQESTRHRMKLGYEDTMKMKKEIKQFMRKTQK